MLIFLNSSKFLNIFFPNFYLFIGVVVGASVVVVGASVVVVGASVVVVDGAVVVEDIENEQISYKIL